MQVLNILNTVHTLRFFSSKCSFFRNSNVFGSCIIHILYTGCAQIKTKFRRQKVKGVQSTSIFFLSTHTENDFKSSAGWL